MKFAKGLLTDEVPEEKQKASVPAVPKAAPKPRSDEPVFVEKDRLFQTVEESKGSSRKYLSVLVVIGILIAGGLAGLWLFNRPGVGSEVNLPAETELKLRDHFLTKEKRTVTTVKFFQCEGFHWARVGVETRNDIPNPLLQIGTYKARISGAADNPSITAVPIMSPAEDVPCS